MAVGIKEISRHSNTNKGIEVKVFNINSADLDTIDADGLSSFLSARNFKKIKNQVVYFYINENVETDAIFGSGNEEPDPIDNEFEQEYQEVLDYATANEIELPTWEQQVIDNEVLKHLKLIDVWQTRDAFFKFIGTAIPAFKLICWKRLIQAEAFGSLTWSNQGVKGNGTNGYIDPHYNPSELNGNFTLENASIGYKLFNEGSTGTGMITGYYGNSDDTTYIIPNNGSSSYATINSNAAGRTTNEFISTEYTQLDRSGSSQLLNNTDNASSGGAREVSKKLFILARNQDQTGADLFSDAGLSWITFGSDNSTKYEETKNVLV